MLINLQSVPDEDVDEGVEEGGEGDFDDMDTGLVRLTSQSLCDSLVRDCCVLRTRKTRRVLKLS